MQRQQKITLGEMRQSGLRRLLVYCSDHKCSHSVVVDSERWGDDVRLSDLDAAAPMSGRYSSGYEWERMEVEKIDPRAGPPRRQWNGGPSQSPLAGAVSR